MGLREICESVETVEIEETSGEDQQNEKVEEEKGGNKKKLVQHFILLPRPQKHDVLWPTALASRLLLECLRKATDIQKATAQALQRCLNGKSQDEIHHVLEYWLEIYRCIMEVCAFSSIVFFPFIAIIWSTFTFEEAPTKSGCPRKAD